MQLHIPAIDTYVESRGGYTSHSIQYQLTIYNFTIMHTCYHSCVQLAIEHLALQSQQQFVLHTHACTHAPFPHAHACTHSFSPYKQFSMIGNYGCVAKVINEPNMQRPSTIDTGSMPLRNADTINSYVHMYISNGSQCFCTAVIK